MSGQFWLSNEQVERLRPHFPKPRGKPRVDDRRVLSGILFVFGNGLRWQDAPAVYGPHKTFYNRFARWSRLGGIRAHLPGPRQAWGRQGHDHDGHRASGPPPLRGPPARAPEGASDCGKPEKGGSAPVQLGARKSA